MANAMIPNSSALQWGTTDFAYGYFESLDIEEASTETVAKNGAGDIKYVNFSEKRWTVTGTYVYRTRTDGTSPDYEVGTGASINLYAGESNEDKIHNDASTVLATIYVTRAKTTRSMDDFMKVDFEGQYYGNLAT